jgi:serine phosphatase RsbU (regulator of sigma subunit)
VLSQAGVLKAQLVSTGPPLGWLPDAGYTVGEAMVEPGDRVLLITDGIEESFAPDGPAFGRDRIFQSLAESAHQPATTQAQGILNAVHGFTGGRQHDDMTILLARLR